MADGSNTRFAIQKLNSDNYAVWSYKMEFLLIKNNLWGVIMDAKPEPPPDAWTKKDNQARATIGFMVEDSQLLHIRNAKTAQDAWKMLKEYHQKSTMTSKIHLLKRICRALLKEDGDMEEHITAMSNNINQLTALGQELPDDIVASLILSSLPESYNTLVTALESRPESDITSQFVKGKLIDEYKKRKGAKSFKDFQSEESAMKSVHKDKDHSTQAKRNCFFCKKPGHFKHECTKYKAWKKKQENVNQVSEETAKTCYKNYLFLSTFEESSEESKCLSTKERKISWIVDSGATSHMVKTKDFFNTLDPSRKGQCAFSR